MHIHMLSKNRLKSNRLTEAQPLWLGFFYFL
nr:MAG TPA: hypothetical protein [Caudoviricetes sp.]